MSVHVKKPMADVQIVYNEEQEWISIWIGGLLFMDMPKERVEKEPDAAWNMMRILFSNIGEMPE